MILRSRPREAARSGAEPGTRAKRRERRREKKEERREKKEKPGAVDRPSVREYVDLGQVVNRDSKSA